MLINNCKKSIAEAAKKVFANNELFGAVVIVSIGYILLTLFYHLCNRALGKAEYISTGIICIVITLYLSCLVVIKNPVIYFDLKYITITPLMVLIPISIFSVFCMMKSFKKSASRKVKFDIFN